MTPTVRKLNIQYVYNTSVVKTDLMSHANTKSQISKKKDCLAQSKISIVQLVLVAVQACWAFTWSKKLPSYKKMLKLIQSHLHLMCRLTVLE